MTEQEWLTVDALDLEAQGVARKADGKVVFIEGALPGEVVACRVARSKRVSSMSRVCACSCRRRPGCLS